jgi:hypothetical protein
MTLIQKKGKFRVIDETTLSNSSGIVINPATSDKQDAQIALETTLNAIAEDQKQSLYVLKQLPKILETLQITDAQYRLMVRIAAGTVDTVTTLNQMGGQNVYFDQTENHNVAYNTGIRNNLSFS